jgi:tRNA A37 threonylcarbamoyladenosine synthetase subunit TsaC/SUA5/YrdC
VSTQFPPATPDNIAWAAEILQNGGPVVFPTETVYGLGLAIRDRLTRAAARLVDAEETH